MAFQQIEKYGIIGNLCTAALVSLDSSIDFFCFPEFDSPSIFAALLDDERGGSFSLRPDQGGFESKQTYIADTNILSTHFMAEEATAELIDFMPVGFDWQRNEIVRLATVIHGEMTFHLRCQPALNYARTKHTIELGERRAEFCPEDKSLPVLMLRSTAPITTEGNAAVASIRLRKGESVAFVLGARGEEYNQSVGCSRPQHDDLDLEDVQRDLNETMRYWRAWIAKSTYTGRWRESVNRSALILKLMSSRRHGSLVAAPTFGLPERLGGERNWDYRYTWIRDAAFTMYAFMRLGLRSECDSFFEWLRGRVRQGMIAENGEERPMQIMYGLDGRTNLDEEQLSSLSGYRGSVPVRVGNGAYDQLQLDIYGAVMDAGYLYSKYGHSVPHENWNRVKDTLKWLSENWNRPDQGIWEERGNHRHFLHSRLMCWVAFDRAIRLADKRSLSAPLEFWYTNRDAIVNDIYDNFWNEKRKAFTQHKDTDALDAAVLLMPLLRFISPVDPMWLSTLDAIQEALAEGALVYRYRYSQSEDGLEGEEGSFTCCSFWLVECLARAGRVEQARRHFDKLLMHSNHLGLFSEEIGRDGHQIGNYPQAFSHLALISAATYLDRALSGKAPEPWAS